MAQAASEKTGPAASAEAPRGATSRRSRYDLNEDYFAVIDTEEKAYWLGFIAADGCLPPLGDGPPRRVTIALAARDAAHLERLRSAIAYTGPLYFGRKNPGRTVGRFCKNMPEGGFAAVTLSVGRKSFASHLVRHGIRPRKSFDLSPPCDLAPGVARHYWRGLFDGDGTIFACDRKRGGREWTVGVVGTREIVDGFWDFADASVGVRAVVRKQGNIWVGNVTGVQHPQAVARLLYEGATVALPRKQRLVEELLATRPGRITGIVVDGRIRSRRDVAANLGIHPGTLKNRIRRGMTPEEAASVTKVPPRTGFGRKLTARGRTLTIVEWAAVLGTDPGVIHQRLDRGDSPEQATRPVRPYRRRTSPAA